MSQKDKSVILKCRVATQGANASKALRFEPFTTVNAALHLIAEKANIEDKDDIETKYCLYWPDANGGVGAYLDNLTMYIHSYGLASQSTIEFRRIPQTVHVQNLEGRKETFRVDFQGSSSEVMLQVCARFGYKNPSSFELLSPGRPGGEVISASHSLFDQMVDPGSTIRLRKKHKVSIWKKAPSSRMSMLKVEKPKPPKKDRAGTITETSSPKAPRTSARRSAQKTTTPAPPRSPAYKKGKFFGVPLSVALSNNKKKSQIPNLVEDALEHIRKTSLDVEGIYRLSGSLVEVEKLKRLYDTGELVDLTKVVDPHVVCGVLKLYLRELPEPLLTHNLYSSFLAIDVGTRGVENADDLLPLINKLPVSSRELLKTLALFLKEVSEHSAKNKMNVTNLATVFGPNFLRTTDEDVLKIVQDSPVINAITSGIISHAKELFSKMSLSASTEDLPEAIEQSDLGYVKAAYDYTAQSDEELSLYVGAVIGVLQQEDSGWWKGELDGQVGLFPVTFCEEIVDEDEDYYEDGAYSSSDWTSSNVYGEHGGHEGEGEGMGEGEGEGEGEGYSYEGEGYQESYFEGEGEGEGEGSYHNDYSHSTQLLGEKLAAETVARRKLQQEVYVLRAKVDDLKRIVDTMQTQLQALQKGY